VAAGRRNSQGTFSGIILGEMEEEALSTGLYGISDGKITF
jgi:hypothetical protein